MSGRTKGRVHPLVTVSYWPRTASLFLIGLIVLSVHPEPESVVLPVMGVALIWPQLAHLLGRHLPVRRAPFHVILMDGVLIGLAVGLTGFSLFASGPILLVVTGFWFLMMGGIRFLLQGLVSLAVGAGASLPMTTLNPLAEPSGWTLVLCAILTTVAVYAAGYLVNDTTRRLVAVK
ncbi:MAG: MASE2 domain-containing protein, partial [Thermoanaerobaculia bacterium]|nr:MASE2 domain-containing protein [Thermoanaerobaculia bacterium]